MQKDVNAFWSICDDLDIPIYVEIEILKNIVKIKSDNVYDFVNKNTFEDYQEPVTEENEDEIPKKTKVKNTIFTNNIECIFDNQIYVKKLKLLPNEITYLKRLASFTNPRFYELQKLRMPVYNTPRIISCFEEDERFLILPRGCIDGMEDICTKSNVELKVKDTREIGEKIDFKFNGKLTSKQTKAMNELLNYDIGVLCVTTGFGKTVVASKIISELKTNTLILVNRTSLLEQWKERLSFFLGINKKEIGQICSGKNKQTKKLDIASLQTLYKQDNIEEILKDYGLVIIDECHHIEILKNKLEELNLNIPIVIYKGNMGKKKVKEFKQLIEDADKQNKSRIILATSTSIGEGFDDSRLDTLFLTMPVSWKGRIIQYVGRLHREHIEKNKVIVYDYLDNMKVLNKMYNRKLKGYKVAGYEIIEDD